jgi:hypothetical protein
VVRLRGFPRLALLKNKVFEVNDNNQGGGSQENGKEMSTHSSDFDNLSILSARTRSPS